MDTEEDIEIKEAQRLGKIQTDEGPYYHESWWEAYKGGVKGMQGGAIIGAAIGALIGAGTALLLPMFGIALGTLTTAGIIGGMAGLGLAKGADKFSNVGVVTGAVAAAHEKAEARIKAFEADKFAEVKQEIHEMKALLTGKKDAADARRHGKPAESAENAEIPEHSRKYLHERNGHFEDYRTRHCDDTHCPPTGDKWVFWKIALIGLAIGAGAGAVLAAGGAGGIAGHLLTELGFKVVAGKQLYIASMTILGLFGASFGINRDMFRQVFDKTDLWFKGIIENSRTRGRKIAMEKERSPETPHVATVTAPIAYEGYIDYPASSTYHRDKVLAAAEKALLSFDHTRATPQ